MKVVLMTLYQNWLMAASQSNLSNEEDEDGNCHEHAFDFQHKDHHLDHLHEARAIIEQTAINREGVSLPAQHLAESLVNALIDKNIITSEKLRQQIETNQMTSVEQKGANVVVEAWLNSEFKKRFLKDGTSTIVEFLKLDEVKNDSVVVENIDKIHNLVVCTVCSCYPRQLLGIPSGWYNPDRIVFMHLDILVLC